MASMNVVSSKCKIEVKDSRLERAPVACCEPAATVLQNGPKETATEAMTMEKIRQKSMIPSTVIHVKGDDSTDVEKGAVASEHVALSITGMTCTGCETKLQESPWESSCNLQPENKSRHG